MVKNRSPTNRAPSLVRRILVGEAFASVGLPLSPLHHFFRPLVMPCILNPSVICCVKQGTRCCWDALILCALRRMRMTGTCGQRAGVRFFLQDSTLKFTLSELVLS